MSGSENDQSRHRDVDAVLAWNHRVADEREIPAEQLPQLTDQETLAFADGEQEFFKRLINGDFDDEGKQPFDLGRENTESPEVANMEPVGLNRAKTISDETDSILERQRQSLINRHQKAGDGLVQSVDLIPEVNTEHEAATVLRDLSLWRLPIDPRKIAAEEGIQLVDGEYGHDFDARIEFLPSIQRFVIFHQGAGPGRPPGRVNFSLAHELAHYYLHRDYLLSGSSHNSESDFSSKNPMERQADEFAAALLMPRELFASRVRQLSRQICTLRDICKLSDGEFRTSVTSTALRYCNCDFEACAVVLSRNQIVLWADYSTDMQMLNMKFIPFGSHLPPDSWSAELDLANPASRCEGTIDADIWFERPYRDELWEESMVLGRTGLALTFLSLPDPELE